jgi:hypothetical protein
VGLLFGAENEITGEKILAIKFQECGRTGADQTPPFFCKLQKFDWVCEQQLKFFSHIAANRRPIVSHAETSPI